MSPELQGAFIVALTAIATYLTTERAKRQKWERDQSAAFRKIRALETHARKSGFIPEGDPSSPSDSERSV